jgi:hypothetical protein
VEQNLLDLEVDILHNQGLVVENLLVENLLGTS